MYNRGTSIHDLNLLTDDLTLEMSRFDPILSRQHNWNKFFVARRKETPIFLIDQNAIAYQERARPSRRVRDPPAANISDRIGK